MAFRLPRHPSRGERERWLERIPASPDLNPIEQGLAKLKTPRRQADERTVEDSWQRIGRPLDIFGPQECRNDNANVGYASS